MPEDGIIGAVDTVRRKGTVSFLNKTSRRDASQYEICGGTKGWENELYYVHKLFVHPAKERFVADRDEAKADGVEEWTETEGKC